MFPQKGLVFVSTIETRLRDPCDTMCVIPTPLEPQFTVTRFRFPIARPNSPFGRWQRDGPRGGDLRTVEVAAQEAKRFRRQGAGALKYANKRIKTKLKITKKINYIYVYVCKYV